MIALERAIDERAAGGSRRLPRVPIELVSTHRTTYVAGEESAAVHYIDAGDARPTTVPPRPFERGVDRRPTLVQNVETLAHVALIARFGDGWYRELGSGATRGSALVTVGGGVSHPGVIEIAIGTTRARVGRIGRRRRWHRGGAPGWVLRRLASCARGVGRGTRPGDAPLDRERVRLRRRASSPAG